MATSHVRFAPFARPTGWAKAVEFVNAVGADGVVEARVGSAFVDVQLQINVIVKAMGHTAQFVAARATATATATSCNRQIVVTQFAM